MANLPLSQRRGLELLESLDRDRIRASELNFRRSEAFIVVEKEERVSFVSPSQSHPWKTTFMTSRSSASHPPTRIFLPKSTFSERGDPLSLQSIYHRLPLRGLGVLEELSIEQLHPKLFSKCSFPNRALKQSEEPNKNFSSGLSNLKTCASCQEKIMFEV